MITTNAGIREEEGGSWVDVDPYEQGKVLADFAVENAPEGARTVAMSCNSGNLHTESRLAAYKDIYVTERSDAEVMAEKLQIVQTKLHLWQQWKTGYNLLGKLMLY